MTSYPSRKLLLNSCLANDSSPVITNAQSTTGSSAMGVPLTDLNKEIKMMERSTRSKRIRVAARSERTAGDSTQGFVDVHLGASMAVTAENSGRRWSRVFT